MKIIAHKVTCRDILPGELFSAADEFYWSHYDPSSIGQQVYIRTDAPCPPEQADDVIYRIEIE